jgi:hypothetical protein
VSPHALTHTHTRPQMGNDTCTHAYTLIYTLIYIHGYGCVCVRVFIRATVLGWKNHAWGAHSSFSDRKFLALAGTSPLSAFLLRRLAEHAAVRGPAGGRERQGTRPHRTHSPVIHGAHRTSPSAAGMVPRRPTAERSIEQPLLGDVQCSEQLHVRVPLAHMLLVPSHSNVTLSATPSRCARYVASMRILEYVSASSTHRSTPRDLA